MELTIQIPDDLYRHAAEVAASTERSVEDILAGAVEQMIEFQRLEIKASRGSREKFLAVMNKVPAAPPPEEDTL